VWLAKATANPIIPFHIEANRHWTMKSWDRTQVPKPFARIALAFAPPIQVPRDAGDSDLNAVNKHLEETLKRCEQRCMELLCR
jgi:lysophospholipid acyltransferase (LPLAT)-like uncharacterized protein